MKSIEGGNNKLNHMKIRTLIELLWYILSTHCGLEDLRKQTMHRKARKFSPSMFYYEVLMLKYEIYPVKCCLST